MYRNIAQPIEKPEEEEPAEIHVPAVTPGEPIAVMPEAAPVTTEPTVETPTVTGEERPKKPKQTQQETPKHILDIPENIDDWD